MPQGQIAKGAIISYASIFLNIAVTFFYTPWMIRQIGVSDYGLFSLVSSFLAYFILDFGLSGTIARFIAKYRAEGNQSKIENMLGLTTKLYLIIDSIIFLILFVCYFFLTEIFDGLTLEEIERFKILYIIAGTFSILTFIWQPMNGAMMAYEYFVESKSIDMIQRIGSVACVVAVLLLGGRVYELVLVMGVTGFLASFVKFMVFRSKSEVKINWCFYDKNEVKSLMSFSIWVFLTSMAQRFRLSMMPAVLGIFANSTEISIFALGMAIEGMVYKLSSALNGLFLPKVTRILHGGESKHEDITNLMIRVGRLQLYIISLIIFGFWLVGKQFLKLWVGDDFKMSYYVVILLTISNIISLTQHIADNVIYAENKVRFTASMILLTSFLGLIIAAFLSPEMGALGCSIAFAFAVCSYLVAVNVFYQKELKINITRFFKECHLKILPFLAILTVAFYLLKGFVRLSNWLEFGAFVGIYSLMYFIFAYLFLFNEEEKKIVRLRK